MHIRYSMRVLQQVYYVKGCRYKMLFVFKYLFCTVHLHIIHITVRKFNNEYVSSCQLCKMGGMVELKGNVIGKHTSAHILLEVQ